MDLEQVCETPGRLTFVELISYSLIDSSVKLFEGDIYPNQFEKKVAGGKYPSEDEKREARRYRAYLWRTRIVPYVIASDFGKPVYKFSVL